MAEPGHEPRAQRRERRFLVTTGAGEVVVVVNPAAGGLSDDLLSFEPVSQTALEQVDMTTPLSAFGAKVVDLIELHGTAEFTGSAALREMLVREKATLELRRIERFAKAQVADADEARGP